MATPKSVIELAKKAGAKMVDIKFVDTFGTWQHFTMPIGELSEETFAEGIGFDGSSIRGWKSIEASDMLAMPDPDTAFIDPFWPCRRLSLTCTVAETGTLEPYSRDPRGIAQKAEKYLISTGIGDQAFFGPEAEFFIFDNVQFDSKCNGTFYSIDSEEGIWNTGRDEMPNLGNKIRHKEGYFPVAPADTQQDIRTEMVLMMEELGVDVEKQHHEVATAGQAEIDYRFSTLVTAADWMMIYKYVVKNVAKKHGKTACFMPKPLFGDNGSGMHTHQSIWKKGKPLFAGKEYGGLSKMALHYAGGLLKHAKALCAICNPTTNSYKRLVPGLRSAGQPRLQRAQPQRRRPHPDLQRQPEVQAPRISSAGPGGESVSLLRRAAHGRPGRHPKQDQSGRTAGQKHLRTAAGRTEESPERGRQPQRSR